MTRPSAELTKKKATETGIDSSAHSTSVSGGRRVLAHAVGNGPVAAAPGPWA